MNAPSSLYTHAGHPAPRGPLGPPDRTSAATQDGHFIPSGPRSSKSPRERSGEGVLSRAQRVAGCLLQLQTVAAGSDGVCFD